MYCAKIERAFGEKTKIASEEMLRNPLLHLVCLHFGGVTVQNLTVENFSSDGEFTTTGEIAAYADGKATFKNIALFNCNPRVYNTGNGGIVGWDNGGDTAETASNFTFENITIDEAGLIMSASGYYIGQTSDADGLKSSTTTEYTNTISINADGTINIVSGGAYLRYNAASGQYRFRYYRSGSYTDQKAICLYKLVEVE